MVDRGLKDAYCFLYIQSFWSSAFHLSVENNSQLLWFSIVSLRDWLKNTRYFSIQSLVMPKTNRDSLARVFPALRVSYLHRFGALIGWMNVSASDWLECYDFGFGLMILRRKYCVSMIIQNGIKTTLFASFIHSICSEFQKTKQRPTRKKITQQQQKTAYKTMHTNSVFLSFGLIYFSVFIRKQWLNAWTAITCVLCSSWGLRWQDPESVVGVLLRDLTFWRGYVTRNLSIALIYIPTRAVKC